MKIFLLSPIASSLLNDEQRVRLQAAGDLRIIDMIAPIGSLAELNSVEGGERVLAIDPDFCGWKISNEEMAAIPELKAIVLQTTSFSYLDVEFCKSKEIAVINLKGFSAMAVAEWAVMAALNLARRVPVLIKDGWKLDFIKHRGFELRGKTAGVIGLGRIGKLVAENCAGLGMKVQYCSRTTEDARLERTELATLMATSDVVFMCLPKNKETSKLLTDEMIRGMKKTAIFVRTGFAPNHELLLELVKDEKIFGYGFDEDESTFMSCVGNVWACPPNAWLTNESVSRNAEMWVSAIEQAVKGEYPERVN